MSSKLIDVCVSTMDAELKFSIKKKTTGKELFENVSAFFLHSRLINYYLIILVIGGGGCVFYLKKKVAQLLKIHEIWYFGLQYQDTKGLLAWLELNEQVLSQEEK